jgi:hypothetical protein
MVTNISANFPAAASAAIRTKFRYVQHLHGYLLQLKGRNVKLTDYESVSEGYFYLFLKTWEWRGDRITAAHIGDCGHYE